MINKLTIVLGVLCLLFSNILISQMSADIMVYDFATQQFDTIQGAPFDQSIQSVKTENYTGLQSSVSFDLKVPQSNLVEETQFTYQLPVSSLYDEISYPLSTSVKIVLPNSNDRHQCTGVMISENFVMSSAHCALETYENKILMDNLDVIAGYDKTLSAGQELRASVKRVYFIKDWNIGNGEDIAIYELDKPLGLFSGWMSIGYEEDQSSIEGEVLHKMSYPAYGTPFTDKEFDGQDLHISYGVVDYVVPEYIGVRNHLVGAGGESGSPIFKTDNEDEYTALGVLTWAGFHNHSRFTAPVYFAYENILKSSDQVLGSILPVDILEFDVTATDNNIVQIDWSIENEFNMEGYEVERSFDGETFEYIDFVSAGETSYSINDHVDAEGTVLYRLKTLSLNGESRYTDLRSVSLIGEEVQDIIVNVYPNPSTEFVNIESNVNSEILDVKLIDVEGKAVYQKQFNDAHKIDLQNIVAGTYHLIVSGEDKMETKTIIVQK